MSQKEALNSNANERLLEAAGKLFAQKGFSKTSVREICQASNVNVASVNYYFQNKENLYFEVVKHWVTVAFEKYPLDYAANEANPPEKRLKSFIQCQLMHTLYQVECPWFGALMSRESLEPTRAIRELTENCLGPSIDLLLAIVRQIMGRSVSEDAIRAHCASILGQCTFYHYSPSIIRQDFLPEKCDIDQINLIAEHIYSFSMLALRGYQQST